MKRRHFVTLTTTGTLALALPIACADLGKVGYDPILEQPNSLSDLLTPEQIQSIGTKYLETNTNEATVRSLVKNILTGIENDTNLDEALATKISTDFKTHATTTVAGWVLSTTEARQCALATLTKPN